MDKSVVNIVLKVFKKYKMLTASLLTVIIGAILMSLANPYVLKYIIDDYLSGVKTNNLLLPALLYFLVLMLVGNFNFMKEGLITIFGQKIIRNIKEVMMLKLERIPVGYLSENESGVIISRFSNDVEAVGDLFTNGIVSMIVDTFKIIGIVISIWLFSYKLGIIVLIIIPIIYMITRIFQKRMLNAQKKYRVLIGKVNNHIPECINNIQMIKSYSKEKYMEEKYIQYLHDSYNAMDEINFYDSIFSPIIIIIRSLTIAIVVILSSNKLGVLDITVGTVAASIEFITSIFSPIESLGMELQNIQQSIAGIYRINEFLNENEEIEKATNIDYDYFKNNDISLDIEFEKVYFNYDEKQEVLKDISLKIKKKENVTISGRTGVGKTTLFKLILGLLEPTKGRVTIGEIDTSKIPNNEKRKIFGYVEQKFSFVSGSVLEQITLGDKTIHDKEVEDAIKFVGLHDYIIKLENGYNTYVNEYLFSQGQQQLLSIARAIVTDPPIILLDEMTANLDSETEKNIISVLKKASKERTVISISHRLSSILTSEKIIRLENKKIR